MIAYIDSSVILRIVLGQPNKLAAARSSGFLTIGA